MKTKKKIENKIKQIIQECGNAYASVKSPRAKSKLMALEWVLEQRTDI